MCKEVDGLELADGTQKIFFNTTAVMDGASEKLRNLLSYIESGTVSDDVTKRIEQSVEQARANAAWRSEYMKSYVYLEDARYEGRQEGLQQGRQDAILEVLEELSPVPEELQDAIRCEADMETRRKWLMLSAKAGSIDEFIEKSGIKLAATV